MNEALEESITLTELVAHNKRILVNEMARQGLSMHTRTIVTLASRDYLTYLSINKEEAFKDFATDVLSLCLKLSGASEEETKATLHKYPVNNVHELIALLKLME
jgi:ssRNA-specific RNase YbeY (16S rRNA maturation enzyme)